MRMTWQRLGGEVVAAGLAAVAYCGSATTGSPEVPDDAATDTEPAPRSTALPTEVPTHRPDPADFVDMVDNPYLPLTPGNRWVYDSASEDGDERIVVTVTDRTRTVAGVTTTVVHDRVTTVAGRVVEDTYDWFAQDVDGNVWYFGEDTTAYEKGRATTEGSWEAGVDGAMAGLVMPAAPAPGQAYQQELYDGEAEDQAEVLAVGESVEVPAGRYDDVVETADFTPLEPRLREQKYYAPGVGVVMEKDVRGGDEVVRLMRFDQPGQS